jgi:hypothetical protein
LAFDYPSISALSNFLLLNHTMKTESTKNTINAIGFTEFPMNIDEEVIVGEVHRLVESLSGLVLTSDQPLMQAGIDSLGGLCVRCEAGRHDLISKKTDERRCCRAWDCACTTL